MDSKLQPHDFDNGRLFEIGNASTENKFIFIDITIFVSLLKSCFDAANNKLKQKRIDSLLSSNEGSDQAARVVIEIISNIEKKELISGIRSGVFKNSLLKEIFLFYNGYFYILPKSLITSKRIYSTIK